VAGRYEISARADADLLRIARHSLAQWGSARAESYVRDLYATLERLAAYPAIGRDAEELRPGIRRLQHASHLVIYRPTSFGVLIVRVLHARQLPTRHI
jgi:toxin ParE1/3/4